MTQATAAKTEKKSVVQILKERDTVLLDLEISLEEFAEMVAVSYSDRWRYHEWRVQGNERLCYWIYDHIIHDKAHTEKISDTEVIEQAYTRFKYIQAHRGQMNFHSVYIRDVEEINVIEPKNFNYVKIRVVKDCLDNLYRYSTSYSIVNGGCSSAPCFYANITEDRTEAVLKGAREIFERLNGSWEAKHEEDKYKPFINKIRLFIESVENEVRQPSLFG